MLFDDLSIYNQMDYWFDDISDRDSDWYYVVDNYEYTFAVSLLGMM